LFPIDSIQKLPELIKQHPELKGLNVTIPYKKEVLGFLTDISHLPQALQACNCIRIKGNSLTGFNTDVTGFKSSIQPLIQPHHTHALILGNGGATAAVKYALSELNIKTSVVGRRYMPGVDLLYSDLNKELIQKHQVIINATPLGTYPDINLFPPIPYEFTGAQHLFFDLVYNPMQTTFMTRGQERGAVAKNGYDMLVIQAEESWKIWRS
jgi:shikimate dehydrogenase